LFSHVPFNASREVISIFGSLTTSDPGDIMDTIQTLKNEKIKCNMVGLSAEVNIFKKICKETGGNKYKLVIV
jgi:transcription initiation factor TFIIH subunit 2